MKVSTLILSLSAVVLCASAAPEAVAQRKKTPAPNTQAVTVTPSRTEQGLRELLAAHEGVATNRGTLKKVGPDHIIVDDDGVQTIIPLQSVQSIKVKKEKGDEGKPDTVTLDIKLVASE